MKRIIIVDDEPTIRLGLEQMLSDANRGYQVVGSYSNGKDALAAILSGHPDFVITDIRMPQMDGLALIEAARHLKAEAAFIILSGYSDFEYARSAVHFGVQDYLLKPIDENELFSALDGNAAQKQDYSETGANRIVEAVKHIVETEYYKDFDLTEIAARVFLSPKYLSRMFKEKASVNIMDYLIFTRMNAAKQMLREEKDLKVYDIAYQVGYADCAAFNKIFKKAVGITPKKYKDTK